MSVLLVEGFETSADQPDVYARGLQTATSPTNVAGIGVLLAPSRNGAAGTGLLLRGAYGSSTAMPCSAAGVSDFGMLPLNQSVYALWASGGFAIGFSASFNSQNTLQIAASETFQTVYDGSQYYWAIVYTGAAYQVAYSTDLKSWTVTAAQPASTLINCTIAVFGSGPSATVIVGSKSGSTAFTPQYTTNQGATWTAMSIGSSTNLRNVVPSGNATTPYVCVGFTSGVGFRIYTFTATNATPVGLTTPALTGNVTFGAAWTRISGSYILAAGIGTGGGASTPVSGGTTVIGYCLSTNNPATAGNWTATTSVAAYLNDACMFGGNIYGAGYGGIWQYNTSNSTWTQVVNTGTTSAWSITTNGTVLVATGQDPTVTTNAAIWTSTNGTTWVKANRFILNSAAVTQGNSINNVYWDGTRFIISGGQSNNFMAVSTDGLSWSVTYVPDFAESAGTACLSFLGVFTGTQSLVNGIFTPWGVAAGNVSGVGFTAGAVAASARTVTPTTITAGALSNVTTAATSVSCIAGTTGQQPPATLTHYYELIFTAVAGTPNLFNVSWALDNGSMGPLGQFQMASSADTGTAQAYLNLPRTGNFTMVDDIYLTNFAGSYHNNRLGVQRIYPLTASSDVGTDQFSNTIGGNTNAKTVNQSLSNSEGFVYATTTTAQDVYGTVNTAPTSGIVINAVAVEGFLSTYSTNSAGTGQVGVQSSGVQKLGSNITTNNSPARATVIAELDPNTNAPWTNTALNAVDIVVGKTS